MDTPNDPTTTYAAWSQERGWHTVSAEDHAALQAGIVASITRRAPSGWADRARAGVLVSKDMTGTVRS